MFHYDHRQSYEGDTRIFRLGHVSHLWVTVRANRILVTDTEH